MLWLSLGALWDAPNILRVSEQDGRVVDKVEGADAAAVTRMVQKHCPQSQDISSKAGSIAPPKAYSNGSALHSSAAPSGQSLEARVEQLINAEPIMLFMKAGSTPLAALDAVEASVFISVLCIQPTLRGVPLLMSDFSRSSLMTEQLSPWLRLLPCL